jgi:hypothetical protein
VVIEVVVVVVVVVACAGSPGALYIASNPNSSNASSCIDSRISLKLNSGSVTTRAASLGCTCEETSQHCSENQARRVSDVLMRGVMMRVRVRVRVRVRGVAYCL